MPVYRTITGVGKNTGVIEYGEVVVKVGFVTMVSETIAYRLATEAGQPIKIVGQTTCPLDGLSRN